MRPGKAGAIVLRALAFAGNTSKGLVYIVIGLLACGLAFGLSSQDADSQSALTEIHRHPFGQAMLLLIGLGFVAYFVWRLIESWIDPQEEGRGVGGLALRASYALSGAFYLTLGVTAFALALDLDSGSSISDQTEETVSQLMRMPWGPWLVASLGVGVLGFALGQFYEGCSLRFLKRFATDGLSRKTQAAIRWSGRVGIVSRGIIFAVVGTLILWSAYTYNPDQAGGMSEAFQTVARQPFGQWFLSAVALGLLVYGLFCLLLGRFRNVGETIE